MLMTACDVSAIAKPWEMQHKLAKKVADEFFDQGDMEKLRLNTQPIAMMDRERKDELPRMQVNFIDVVCKPLYTTLSESFPWITPLLDGCLANRENWADLAEKVEMGLTCIDHDTIEKPVEQVDITVETLGQQQLQQQQPKQQQQQKGFFTRRLSTRQQRQQRAHSKPPRGSLDLSSDEASAEQKKKKN